MDDYFAICQYKTEEPRDIETSAPISLEFVLVWNKHAFWRSKMTVWEKSTGYKFNHMSWDTSTLQIHHHSNHLTLPENKRISEA